MERIMISRRAAEIAFFAAFLAIAAWAYRVTLDFPAPLLPGYPGAAMFPRLILATLALICVIGLLRRIATAPAPAQPSATPVSAPLFPFLAAVGTAGAYAVAFSAVGMEPATLALIAGGVWLHSQRPVVALLAGAVTVLVAYVVFVQVLSVPLPLAVLPRYLG